MLLRSGTLSNINIQPRKRFRKKPQKLVMDPPNENENGQNVVLVGEIDKYTRCTLPNITYDGDPYTLNEFLFDYKLGAEAMAWTDVQRIRRLPLHLKGMAKQVFVNLTVDDRSTWEKLTKAFQKNILIEPSPRIHLNSFRRRIMKQGETPIQFAYALRMLVGEAFTEATSDQKKAFLFDQFMYGIPGNLRSQIVDKENFDDAVKKAQIIYLSGDTQKTSWSGDTDNIEHRVSNINIYDSNMDRNNKNYDYRPHNRSDSRDRRYFNKNESNNGNRNSNFFYRPYDGRQNQGYNNKNQMLNFRGNKNFNGRDQKYVRFSENRFDSNRDNLNSHEQRDKNNFNFNSNSNDSNFYGQKLKRNDSDRNNLNNKKSFDKRQNNFNHNLVNTISSNSKMDKNLENDRDKINFRGQVQCSICHKFGHGPRTCWFNSDNFPNTGNKNNKQNVNFIGDQNFEVDDLKREINDWQIKYNRLAGRYEEDTLTYSDYKVDVSAVFEESDEEKIDKIYKILIMPNVEKIDIKEALDKLLKLTVPVKKIEKLIPVLLKFLRNESPYKGLIKVLIQKYGNEQRNFLKSNDKFKIEVEVLNHDKIYLEVNADALIKKVRRMLNKKLNTKDIILIEFYNQNLDDDEYLIECGLLLGEINTLSARIVLPEQNIHELGEVFLKASFDKVHKNENSYERKNISNDDKSTQTEENTETRIVSEIFQVEQNKMLKMLNSIGEIATKVLENNVKMSDEEFIENEDRKNKEVKNDSNRNLSEPKDEIKLEDVFINEATQNIERIKDEIIPELISDFLMEMEIKTDKENEMQENEGKPSRKINLSNEETKQKIERRLKERNKKFQWINTLIPYILLFILSGKASRSEAIEAYDCSKLAIGTTYSLMDIENCPGANPSNLTVKDGGTYHIYQESDFYRTIARECIVFASETIHHCGMHSHSSIVKAKGPDVPKIPTASTCNTAFQTNELRLDHNIVLQAKKGYKKHQREFVVGTVQNNGACQGGEYKISGTLVKGIVVIHDYTVELREYQVSFDTNTGKMMSRPYCRASFESCETDNSILIYKVNTNLCNLVYIKADKFNKITGYTYKPVQSGRTVLESEPIPEEKTPEVIMSTSPGIHMRFILKESITKCDESVRSTNYKGIYVSRKTLTEAKTALDKTDVNTFTYFNNKMDFLFHTNRKSMEKAYEETVRNDCKLNREILRTKLAVAITNPNIVTPLLPLEKGIFGRMMGEVLFTYKCSQVNVVLAQTLECTNELPVVYEGKLRYVEPITRILSPPDTVIKPINCSNVLAPIYQITPTTWVSLPGKVKVDNPKQLELMTLEKGQVFKELEGIATSGLYSPADIEAARKYILFPQQQQKVMTEIVQLSMQGGSGEPDFERLLSPDHFKRATLNTLKKMWGKFLVFGQAMSGMMGVYFIITLIKVVISQVLSVYHIHAIKGVTWKLIFGCFPFLAKYIIINHYKEMDKITKDEKKTVYQIARKSARDRRNYRHRYSVIGNNDSGSSNEPKQGKLKRTKNYIYSKLRKPPKATPLHAYLAYREKLIGTDVPSTSKHNYEINRPELPIRSSSLRNSKIIYEPKSHRVITTLGDDDRIVRAILNSPIKENLPLYPFKQLGTVDTDIKSQTKDDIELNNIKICSLWMKGGRVPCVWLCLDGKQIKGVVDTGSPISIINSTLLTPSQWLEMFPMEEAVTTISGTSLEFEGKIFIQLNVYGYIFPATVAIMRDCPYSLLVGMNIIETLIECDIDCMNQIETIGTPDDLNYFTMEPKNKDKQIQNDDDRTSPQSLIASSFKLRKCSENIKIQAHDMHGSLEKLEQLLNDLKQKSQQIESRLKDINRRNVSNSIEINTELNINVNESGLEQEFQSYVQPGEELATRLHDIPEESEETYFDNRVLMIESRAGSKGKPHEAIRINNRLAYALLDTGASVSIIDKKFIEGDDTIIIRPIEEAFRSASGHFLDLCGSVEVSILIRKQVIKHKFYIINTGPESCILGMDFLNKIKNAKIDLLNGSLEISPNPSEKVSEKSGKYVKVTETANLLPYAETIFKVKVDQPEGIEVLFEPSNFFAERHNIAVCSCLCIVRDGEIPVRISNYDQVPTKLYKGEKLGTMEIIDKEIGKLPNRIPNDRQCPVDLKQSNLTEYQEKKMNELVNRYQIVFAADDNDLGRTKVIEHSIPLDNNRPLKQRPYRIPYALREECDRQIKFMLENDVIRPSSSPWMSPVVLVKKKDSSIRFCVDFRKLNEVTRKDTYPLPRIDEMLDKLHNATIFTTLDLQSGYWQIPIVEEDKEKTAFSAGQGLYEFNVMPFGLTGAPATFQRCMNYLLMDVSHAMVYIDDIIVYSKNFEEHLPDLEEVLKILKKNGLKLKPSKCEWVKPKVTFLGHVVSAEGMTPDPENIAKVKTFPVPKSIKEVQRFVGLASYYRRFIKDFAMIAAPLHKLTSKESEFIWTEVHQKAFEELKQKLITPPILRFPNLSKPFLLMTDASGYALGAVLGQQDDKEKDHVIAYTSRGLKPHEKNYSTIEKELLAIVFGTKQFRHYIWSRKVILLTDHRPLQWLKGHGDPTSRLVRWMLQLQEFDIHFQYRTGKSNANADCLSRIENQIDPNSQKELSSVFSIHDDNDFEILTIVKNTPNSNSIDMRREQDRDDELKEIMKNIANQNSDKTKVSSQFEIDGGVLKFNSGGLLLYVVPKHQRKSLLLQYHDGILGGHLSTRKTLSRLKKKYYWPTMQEDTKNWCKSCTMCLTRKDTNKLIKVPLKPIPPPTAPMEMTAMDILGPFPETADGNKYILVFSDYFTRWPEAFAIKNQTAEVIAQIFVEQIIFRYGVPKKLLTDQGTNFTGNVLKAINELFQILKLQTSPYHPQTDGLVERFNRTLANMLSTYTNSKHNDWDVYIPSCLFAYRNSVHASTNETPFFLMYLRESNMPIDLTFSQPIAQYMEVPDYVTLMKERLGKVWTQAGLQLKYQQEQAKETYDRTAKEHVFKVGDKVMVSSPLTTKGHSNKLHRPFKGPFEVIKVTSTNLQIRKKRNADPIIIHVNRCRLVPSTEKGTEERYPLRSRMNKSNKPSKNNVIGMVMTETCAIYIWVRFHGKFIRGILDSGSPISILSAELLTMDELYSVRRVFTPYYAIDGHHINTMGSLQFYVELGGQKTIIPMIIIMNCAVDCLIGMDLISRLNLLNPSWFQQRQLCHSFFFGSVRTDSSSNYTTDSEGGEVVDNEDPGDILGIDYNNNYGYSPTPRPNFPPYRPVGIATRITNNSLTERQTNIIDFEFRDDRRRPPATIETIRDKNAWWDREINISFRIRLHGLGTVLLIVILSLMMLIVRSSHLVVSERTKNLVLTHVLLKDTYIVFCKTDLKSAIVNISCSNANVILKEQYHCESCDNLLPDSKYKMEIIETEIKELNITNETIKKNTTGYITVRTSKKQFEELEHQNGTRSVTLETQKDYILVCKRSSENETVWIRCGENNILLQREHKCNICFYPIDKTIKYLVVTKYNKFLLTSGFTWMYNGTEEVLIPKQRNIPSNGILVTRYNYTRVNEEVVCERFKIISKDNQIIFQRDQDPFEEVQITCYDGAKVISKAKLRNGDQEECCHGLKGDHTYMVHIRITLEYNDFHKLQRRFYVILDERINVTTLTDINNVSLDYPRVDGETNITVESGDSIERKTEENQEYKVRDYAFENQLSQYTTNTLPNHTEVNYLIVVIPISIGILLIIVVTLAIYLMCRNRHQEDFSEINSDDYQQIPLYVNDDDFLNVSENGSVGNIWRSRIEATTV